LDCYRPWQPKLLFCSVPPRNLAPSELFAIVGDAKNSARSEIPPNAVGNVRLLMIRPLRIASQRITLAGQWASSPNYVGPTSASCVTEIHPRRHFQSLCLPSLGSLFWLCFRFGRPLLKPIHSSFRANPQRAYRNR